MTLYVCTTSCGPAFVYSSPSRIGSRRNYDDCRAAMRRGLGRTVGIYDVRRASASDLKRWPRY